jgi:hypothetical protein
MNEGDTKSLISARTDRLGRNCRLVQWRLERRLRVGGVDTEQLRSWLSSVSLMCRLGQFHDCTLMVRPWSRTECVDSR